MLAVFCVPGECLLRFGALPSLGKGARAHGQVKHFALRSDGAFGVLGDLEFVFEGLLEAKFRLGGKGENYILPSILVTPFTTTFFFPLILLVNNSTL
jgi:hypothetical protein